jgi:hypothetical protein
MLKTKIRSLFRFQKVLAFFSLTGLILLCLNGFSIAQTVTQGYGSDQPMQRGMIVNIKESDTTKVEPLSTDNAEKMLGVIVNPNDAPVTLSLDGQQVFVATTGRYDVLVTTQNGDIKAGDYITISSLNGLGMKVDDKNPVVVGRALADFDQQNAIGRTEVGDVQVTIGRVQTDIAVSRNPLQRPTQANVPEFLARAAETVAGREVSALRIYLSLAVFIISVLAAGSLMYSGVRSGIISIGRNPLSKKSIIRGMLQVIVVGLIIFISGVFGVYLILKL